MGSPDNTAPSTSASGSSVTSVAAADLQLVSPGTFTFALSGQLKPFSFYKAGVLTGFDYDIGMGLAKELGLEGKAVTGPFNTLLAGVQAGRYDAIVGSMTNTPERAKAADFTDNYYESGAYLWVPLSSPVTSVADLKDATVGVVLGSTFEAYAKKQPNIKDVKTYQSDIDAIVDVASGRIDGAIADQLVGSNAVTQAKLPIHRVGESLIDNSAAIPVRKGNTSLVAAINKALANMHADGSYSAISQKWFGEDISADTSSTASGTATSGG